MQKSDPPTKGSGVTDLGATCVGRHPLKTLGLHWCNYSLSPLEQQITTVIMLAHQAHTGAQCEGANPENIGEGAASSDPAKQFHIADLVDYQGRAARRTSSRFSRFEIKVSRTMMDHKFGMIAILNPLLSACMTHFGNY